MQILFVFYLFALCHCPEQNTTINQKQKNKIDCDNDAGLARLKKPKLKILKPNWKSCYHSLSLSLSP